MSRYGQNPCEKHFSRAVLVSLIFSLGENQRNIARAAGTVAANVNIVAITEAELPQRPTTSRGGIVKVDTKIRTSDASSSSAVLSILGREVDLKNLLNAEFASQGLHPATDVSSPSSSQQVTTAVGNESVQSGNSVSAPAGGSRHTNSGVSPIGVVVGSAAGGVALVVVAAVVWYKSCRTRHLPTTDSHLFSASPANLASSLQPSDAAGQTSVSMDPTGSSSSGAGSAVTGPLQSLAAPPPEPSNASNAEDENIIGLVYSIDALHDYGFVPGGQAFLPPGGQAMDPAASYHLGAGTWATRCRQALAAPSPVPSAPLSADDWNDIGIIDTVHCSNRRSEAAGNSVETNLEGKCVVCLEHDPVIVLLPCGHLCLCEGCAPVIDRCPLCRREVQEAKRIYRS